MQYIVLKIFRYCCVKQYCGVYKNTSKNLIFRLLDVLLLILFNFLLTEVSVIAEHEVVALAVDDYRVVAVYLLREDVF